MGETIGALSLCPSPLPPPAAAVSEGRGLGTRLLSSVSQFLQFLQHQFFLQIADETLPLSRVEAAALTSASGSLSRLVNACTRLTLVRSGPTAS